MIEIQNLNFSYKQNVILKNINLNIEENTLTFLLGKNGSGKSTLLKCILGILKSSPRTIKIKGNFIEEIDFKSRAKLLAYLPQVFDSKLNLSVLDVILMGKISYYNFFEMPKPEDIIEIENILKSLKIGYLRHKKFSEISGGEQQLVLIARAIIQKSKILILDEPYSNLDIKSKFFLMDILKGLINEGYTILLTSHNPQDAFLFADNVVLLKNGEIFKQGKADILSASSLSTLYDTPIDLLDTTYKNIKLCIPKRSSK